MFPTAAGAAFLVPYYNRSKASGTSIPTLLKQDVENFNKDEALERVKKSAPMIAGLIIGGKAVKTLKPLPKGLSGITGDLMLGAGVGTLAKAVLDPPYVEAPKQIPQSVQNPAIPYDRPLISDRSIYNDYAAV